MSSNLDRKLKDAIDRQIKVVIPNITKEIATRIRSKVKIIARIWRRDVFDWMGKPSAPGMPTRRTGELVKALHYSTERLTKNRQGGYSFMVIHGWRPTTSKTSGEDYGSIINAKTSKAGYRDRVKFELDSAINRILKGK